MPTPVSATATPNQSDGRRLCVGEGVTILISDSSVCSLRTWNRKAKKKMKKNCVGSLLDANQRKIYLPPSWLGMLNCCSKVTVISQDNPVTFLIVILFSKQCNSNGCHYLRFKLYRHLNFIIPSPALARDKCWRQVSEGALHYKQTLFQTLF